MQISIIIPVYKAEKYIRRCVDSLIEQTYKDIEIVLVDDGSPDNCPKICDEYAKQDKRVKVIHCKNGGSMKARQIGFEAASGDYIGFADSDDWAEPDMYERLAEAAKKYDADITTCGYYIEFPGFTKEYHGKLQKEFYDKTDMEKEIYPNLFRADASDAFLIEACCWNKLYKKEILAGNITRVDGKAKVGEDSAFVFSSVIDSDRIAFVEKCLYHYFCHENSIMTGYDPKMPQIVFLPAEALWQKNEECGNKYTNQLYYYTLRYANVFTLNEVRAGNKKSFFQKRKDIKNFINNKLLQESAHNVNLSELPKKTRLLTKVIRWRSVTGMQLYILAKSLYIRKIRKREKMWK